MPYSRSGIHNIGGSIHKIEGSYVRTRNQEVIVVSSHVGPLHAPPFVCVRIIVVSFDTINTRFTLSGAWVAVPHVE